jgi:hypothetical protein
VSEWSFRSLFPGDLHYLYKTHVEFWGLGMRQVP